MKRIAFVKGYDIVAVSIALLKGPDIILIEVQYDGDKLVLAPEDMLSDFEYLTIHDVLKFVNKTADIGLIVGRGCDIVRLCTFMRHNRNSLVLTYGDTDLLSTIYLEFPDATLGLCERPGTTVCDVSIDFFVDLVVLDRRNAEPERIEKLSKTNPNTKIFLSSYEMYEPIFQKIHGIVVK